MNKLSPAAQLIDTSREIVLQEVTLAAFEQRRLVLQLGVPGDAKKDEFLVCHLTQKTEGLIIGGYTVVVHVAGGVTRDPN